MVNTKTLGLQIDNHINWKNRTEQMVPNAIRSKIHISDMNTVKSIYCAYFHSIVK